MKDAVARGDKERQRRIREKYAPELKAQAAFKSNDNARNRLIRQLSQVRNDPRMPEQLKEKLIKRLSEQIQAFTLRETKSSIKWKALGKSY